MALELADIRYLEQLRLSAGMNKTRRRKGGMNIHLDELPRLEEVLTKVLDHFNPLEPTK